MGILTAGIYQFDIMRGEVDANIRRVLRGISRLSDQGADLAVLPEMFSSSFDYPALSEHARKTPEIIELLSKAATAKSLAIAGSLPEADAGAIYNTLYIIGKDGDIAGKYRKAHLFSMIGEDKNLEAGTSAVVCETGSRRFGLMICYDLRFPEICRTLALKGAEVVIVSAQWPAARIDHWDTLLRARAIENQLFVVAANRYGQEGNLIYPGHSQMISPQGEVIAMSASPESATTARLDLTEIQKFRKQFDCLSERAPSIYEL